MRITISGDPGSGKSTLAKNLVRTLGYPYVNTGQIFRDAAAEHSMTLTEFGAYVDAHSEIDRELDERLVARAREYPNAILEGRLAGWMTKRAEVPAFRIWVTAAENERIRRIMQRDGGDAAVVTEALRARAKREREQYLKIYGLDLADLSPYDVVIHTDDRTPEENLARVLTAIGYTT